jgi:alpha-tubulin suppressor-like RCC1 family protein
VVAVSGGETSSTVVTSDGSVWGWGSDFSGQLGNGDGGGSETPVRAIGISDATAVLMQGYLHNHKLVMRDDGRVYAWGSGRDGALGLGPDHNNRQTPSLIRGLDLR